MPTKPLSLMWLSVLGVLTLCACGRAAPPLAGTGALAQGFVGKGWVDSARAGRERVPPGGRIYVHLHPGAPRTANVLRRLDDLVASREHVEVIGLMASPTREEARDALRALGFSHPCLYGVSRAELARHGITQAPAVRVLDGGGHLIARDLLGIALLAR